ncbi:MAG: aldo/keto reductase [Micrococcales bacterium]|nr:aldo/keto reductase [Micrococcales bacterium]
MTSSAVPDITLNNGVTIPQLGFGTWEVKPAETVETVAAALEVGYRHIDTAQMYGNEREVGEAVRRSGIPREEIFVTSKLNNNSHRPEDVARTFQGTLEALDLGHLDLFLIHWPLPTIDVDYVDTWKAMTELLGTGQVRAVGVSNFQAAHLDRLAAASDVVPAVNQIEVHPFLTQDALRAYDAEHGIATEAWSPLASGQVAEDDTIRAVAEELGRTAAQVGLRWALQRGDIVFPRSVRRERIEENYALFDFELSEEQVQRIAGLNRDERTGPDPDTFDWIPS